MIFDNIKNASKYYNLDEKIKTGLLFLQNNDLKSMQLGKHIIKDDIYINIEQYFPKPIENCKLEAHKKYIDIQYIIEGEEKLGFVDIEDKSLSCETEYNEEKDIIFYTGECNYLKAKQNDFLIFDTNCVHKPQIAVDSKKTQVKKAVVKIKKQTS